MSDATETKPDTTKPTVDAPSGIHMSKPLDEMSMASVAVVADAAAIIAQKKMEAAAAKMAAAQAAMDRLAALKAGKPAPIAETAAPEAPKPAAVEAKPVVAEAPKPAPKVIEQAPKAVVAPIVSEPDKPKATVAPAEPKPAVAIEAAKAIKPKAVEAPVAKTAPAPEPPKAAPVERPVQHHESGIVRLATALRAKAADQAAPLPKITGKRSLDPVANHSGLGRPSTAKPRKIVTPGLIFLLALMTFYALYASGNLPQFDRWTDSVVNDAHAHNDQVVGGILGAGRYILIGGGVLIVLIAGLLIKNYVHQKHNEEHEREFHTR